MLAAGLQQPVHASGADLSKFRRIEPQYIAALGDPRATSGSGAQSWGLWSQDPGPRGCKLDRYDQLKAAGGVAPSQWKFDAADWWLEEHGLIMEKPTFPLPPGKYLVTGDRKVTTVLTIQPKDKNGNQRWELADGATLRMAIEGSGVLRVHPDLQLEQLSVGVFSRPRPLDAVVHDGDRIEIYRPLLVDPKEARRHRAELRRRRKAPTTDR